MSVAARVNPCPCEVNAMHASVLFASDGYPCGG